MKFLKENISWMAPTAAIVFVGVGLLDREVGFTNLFSGQEDAQIESEAAARVALLNQTVLAALDTAETSQEVSRNAPVDLLTPLAPAAPVQNAVVETPAIPVTPEADAIDQESAADFFNNAARNLALADACSDDLKALTAQARVYFPSGAASGDAAGLNAARLIGLVAHDCPGYAVRVEGHSDASGDPVTNLRLSEKRAQTVINRLSASGIDTSKFVAVGLGDTQPSGIGGPQDGGFYDRRVEFSVITAAQQASFSPQDAVQVTPQAQAWRTVLPACAEPLAQRANELRQFYTPGSITVAANELDLIYDLAGGVASCDGARLRLVGQHEDQPGSREGPGTGRLRALAMMSTLVSAGFPGDQILIAAPSRSIDVQGQPGLPNSRLDFQVVAD